MRQAEGLLRHFLVAGFFCSLAIFAAAQGSYRAQLRGTVSDSSGALIRAVTVTITDSGTNISSVSHTDEKGEYYFTGLRPSTYSVKVQLAGFRPEEKTDVVLAVDQEATLNFAMSPAGISEKVVVTMAAPLLDTESATLGTDITNEYVKDLPLLNRSFFGLTFLSGGVTEVAGAGTQDNYPEGTNFVSNGQRNATADVRIDGALISAPEQGEGATSNVYYEPSVEIIQEFKVQNNSFSAEFGNNGGTVVNMVLKSGTNSFHGSGWWFGQRSALDANDFFNNAAGVPKPATTACTRDRFGSLGSASSTGALTLSTVQLGDAAPFATSWSTSVAFGGNIISAKFAGMAVRCMSLKRCRSIGLCAVSAIVRMLRPSSPKFACPSCGWMLSRAERSCALSAIGCVSISICPPSAITCAF